jgi:hypothetical protein
VRAETLPVTTRMQVPLAANGGAITVDSELLAASILDGASVSVGVSRDTAFDIPSLLMTLDRYPYGCAEQTTSRALPLLYVSQLARNAGLPDDPDLKKRIQGAIDRVLNYQSSAGSFGLWGPGGGDPWLDAYVTDFLTRAREQGYRVPEQAMMQALDNLQNTLAYNNDLSSQRQRDRLCALCAGAQPPRVADRPALLFGEPDRRVLEPDGAGAAGCEPGALRRPDRRGKRLRLGVAPGPGDRRRNRSGARITARGCATARRCWRSPPRPSLPFPRWRT